MSGEKRLEVDLAELEGILARSKTAPLSEAEYTRLHQAVQTLSVLTRLVEDRRTTIHKLRQLLFGASTERTRDVVKQEAAPPAEPGGAEQPEDAAKADGHGRNGADVYVGATKIRLRHDTLKPGERCPSCARGKLYASGPPLLLVRATGQAPLGATVYEVEKLRCNLCQKLFPARTPAGVGKEKYDAGAGGMIALLKYGCGIPFHRLERLQDGLGLPLPASTQWDIVREVAENVEPAFHELIRQAARGEVLHNDDTSAKILALRQEAPRAEEAEELSADGRNRTGIFTTGIVSAGEGRHIALFFTGRDHAGENLAKVLAARAAELGPPIQMCDALSRNLPANFEVVLANCTAHGRRKFVDIAGSFPAQCRYVLEILAEVYRHDGQARDRGLSPGDRLAWHQARSGPRLAELKTWLDDQIVQKKAEPNSGLGKAIAYLRKHWPALTLFLRVPGAPLDNNLCERILKKAILHRKNALFFKTAKGAQVADIFMSLIHTCELAKVNAFDYLIELQRHAGALRLHPGDWLPWNYRQTMELRQASPAEPPPISDA